MKYKKHFITNAIFRIDFANQEESLKKELDSKIKEACLKNFPIPETVEMQKKEVQVNGSPEKGETIVKSEKVTEWHFWGKDREKKLVLTSQSMFVDFSEYESFGVFKKEFFEAYEALQTSYPDIKINRVGLRYIDQIQLLGGGNVKNWKSFWSRYIAADLVGALQFPDIDKAITRHMTSIEMNYGDCMLRFQYGIYNNDYPAPNKKKDFILDTDVYSSGLYTMEEIEGQMDSFHEKTKKWFERSIKQPLREKMGVVTNE